jgi:hypothetical protein
MKYMLLNKSLFYSIVALLVFCNFPSLIARSLSESDDIKEKDVPAVVVNSVKDKFSNIYVYDWEWNKKDYYYRAKFVFKGDEYKVYLTPAGDVFKTDQKTQFVSLPQIIQNSFKLTKYSSWFISEVRQLTDRGITTYEIKVQSDKKRKLRFDASGKFIEDKKD